MNVEVFRADAPPNVQRYSDLFEAGIVRGNMGSLVVVRLGPGLELEAHAHEQEHVGAVLEGEFSFVDGTAEVRLRAGDLYRVAPYQRHGVRCAGRAVIVQVRA